MLVGAIACNEIGTSSILSDERVCPTCKDERKILIRTDLVTIECKCPNCKENIFADNQKLVDE